MFELQLKNFIEEIRSDDDEIRKQVDLGYSWDGHNAVLYEIRPAWDDSGKVLQLPFAKLQFVKTKQTWKLSWMRASGDWEAYKPHPTDADLVALLKVIGDDELNCFFG